MSYSESEPAPYGRRKRKLGDYLREGYGRVKDYVSGRKKESRPYEPRPYGRGESPVPKSHYTNKTGRMEEPKYGKPEKQDFPSPLKESDKPYWLPPKVRVEPWPESRTEAEADEEQAGQEKLEPAQDAEAVEMVQRAEATDVIRAERPLGYSLDQLAEKVEVSDYADSLAEKPLINYTSEAVGPDFSSKPVWEEHTLLEPVPTDYIIELFGPQIEAMDLTEYVGDLGIGQPIESKPEATPAESLIEDLYEPVFEQPESVIELPVEAQKKRSEWGGAEGGSESGY